VAQSPRLLYDQAHGESAPPGPLVSIAKTLGMADLATSTNPIAAEALDKTDILYLRAPSRAFTAAEKEAIIAFVKSGGSLLLVLDEESRQSLATTGVNDLIVPFGMKLTPDTEYLHNCGGIAKAGEINEADRELPYSGGRAVEGGTPFAWQLDKDGKPAQPFAAFKALDNGARIIVMGEGMASLFMGTKEGQRLSGVPHDPTKTTYWGKDSALFMEEVLAWVVAEPGSISADLAALATDGTGWKLHNLTATRFEKDGRSGVRLTVQDRKAAGGIGTGGVVYLEGPTLSEGSLEFSAYGEPKGGYGVCFAGEDLRTHEAIYFRPYAFSGSPAGAAGAFVEGRDDAVQYVAHPEHGWQKLRTDAKPQGVYEHAVLGPKPQQWFRARIRFTKDKVEVWVDDQPQPCFSVARLHPGRAGKVGLWVGNGAPGIFGSLKVTPATGP